MANATNHKDLKYPIGQSPKPETITDEFLQDCIDKISSFPARLHREVRNLSENQLNTEYRPEGWTIKQVVNHCADSHMNGLIRTKLALTENKPLIRTYLQEPWAELSDSRDYQIEPALKMLEGIHERWATLLNQLSVEQWQRTLIHPAEDQEMGLREIICHYAWHGDHHLAHITSLKKRKSW